VRIALDASAAIEVALGRTDGRRFGDILEEASEVLAPDLLICEVTNTIWKYHQLEHLSLDVGQSAIEAAIGLVDTLISSSELYREAFLLARAVRRPVYDMLYLALARREDAALLTLDRVLRKEAERQSVRVLDLTRTAC
jgi:predicted nucleic acid-binding protein